MNRIIAAALAVGYLGLSSCATTPEKPAEPPVYEAVFTPIATEPSSSAAPPQEHGSLEQKAVGVHDCCARFTYTRLSVGLSGMGRVAIVTPEQFLKSQEPATSSSYAAINGVYFGADNKLEGIVYDGQHYATRQTNGGGYFAITKGRRVHSDFDPQPTPAVERVGIVSETLRNGVPDNWNDSDYYLIIGTRPLLVVDGNVHHQAHEERYNNETAYRSAIGIKDNGKKVCVAVSQNQLTMKIWAKKLKDSGYGGAINLVGGPYSQLAIHNSKNSENGGMDVYCGGKSPATFIIFFTSPSGY